MRTPRWLSQLPVPLRHAMAGAVALGVLGGIAGLIVGLVAYAPTAWFAIFELGVPAAIVGGIVGLMIGSGTRLAHTDRGRSSAN